MNSWRHGAAADDKIRANSSGGFIPPPKGQRLDEAVQENFNRGGKSGGATAGSTAHSGPIAGTLAELETRDNAIAAGKTKTAAVTKVFDAVWQHDMLHSIRLLPP
jgi:hypothetical protein